MKTKLTKEFYVAVEKTIKLIRTYHSLIKPTKKASNLILVEGQVLEECLAEAFLSGYRYNLFEQKKAENERVAREKKQKREGKKK